MIGLKVLIILIGLISFVNCNVDDASKSVQSNSSSEATKLYNDTTLKNIESSSTKEYKGESSITEKNEEIGTKEGTFNTETESGNAEENDEALESEEEIMNQDNIYDGKIKDDDLEEDNSYKFGDYFEPSSIFKPQNTPPKLENTSSNPSEDNSLHGKSGKNVSETGVESPEKKYVSYVPHPIGHFDSLTHNCTVIDVSKSAEISTPRLDQHFETVKLKLKKIVLKDYCYQSVSTICTESERVISNELCRLNYERKQENSIIKSIKVYYKKEATTKWVTVCKHTYQHKLGYDDGYGKPVCKEVSQRIAYNTPVLTPDNIPVTVSYPVPIKKCVKKPIVLPTIDCKTKTEKKCVHVLDVVEEIQELKVCHYKIGKPKWIPLDLKLPKQICAEIVKGY